MWCESGTAGESKRHNQNPLEAVETMFDAIWAEMILVEVHLCWSGYSLKKDGESCNKSKSCSEFP